MTGIIGTSVRLDGTEHTIIGVMPEGFMFPFRHHYWVALRLTGRKRRSMVPDRFTSSDVSPMVSR